MSKTEPCAACKGRGMHQPVTYETDSADEVALAWELAKCPRCNGSGKAGKESK